jgi:hypothetical protein
MSLSCVNYFMSVSNVVHVGNQGKIREPALLDRLFAFAVLLTRDGWLIR